MDFHLTSEIINISNLPEKEELLIDHKTGLLSDVEIERCKEYFINKEERYSDNILRDYTIFMFCIHTKMKICDILNLQIHQIIDADCKIVDSFITPKHSTLKQMLVMLNDDVKEALVNFIDLKSSWSIDDYIFQSYRKKNPTPITTRDYWGILKTASKKINLDIIGHIRYIRNQVRRRNVEYY